MSRRRTKPSPKSPADQPVDRSVDQPEEQPAVAGSRPADRPGRTPATLHAAAAVAGLEALGAAAAGGWLTVEAIITRTRGLGIAASAGVFVLATGVGLGFLAWGLLRGRRWSRGPVVAIQLLMLPLGYELLSGSTTVVGAAMLVAAILTLVLVLAPPSTAVFRE
ncbi:hypothetical protein SAMN05421678_115186 [Actinopolymorpha cephalotaxi]|uniref:Integral membrane protein n=1 Tax=Actinopolymorpha cephalotaxi TaxID=504797 RepID=A0A1I2Z4U1_9ACTN|nr:hypothetical protein [Actinopolymorpha cephalotaxi]NYH81867.1 hypothetical protein [Actinopolymorpha cephalotaxi]SFH32928.1 hypothetical protein SAMN05421678_115186 [Actinopolymorpha cephalotaxi]